MVNFRYLPIPPNSAIAIKWLVPRKRDELLSKFSNFREFPDHFCPEEWKMIDALLQELQRQTEASPLNQNSMKMACQMLEYDYRKSLHLMHRLPSQFFRRYSIQFVPYLSEENIEKRKNFCTSVLNGDIDLHKLITTDECSVQQYPTRGNRNAWAARHQKPPPVPNSSGHGFTVMVFASVGYNYKGKLIVLADKDVFKKGKRKGQTKLLPKTATTEVYCEDILKPLFSDLKNKGMAIELQDGSGKLINGWVFMQDGAPIHVSNVAMGFLDKIFGLENVMSRHNKNYKGKLPKHAWPPRSPDLSPLDFSIWHTLKQKAILKAPLGYYQTREEAADLLLKAWDEIPISDINKAVLGMKNRLQRCLDNGGTYSGRRSKSDRNRTIPDP